MIEMSKSVSKWKKKNHVDTIYERGSWSGAQLETQNNNCNKLDIAKNVYTLPEGFKPL